MPQIGLLNFRNLNNTEAALRFFILIFAPLRISTEGEGALKHNSAVLMNLDGHKEVKDVGENENIWDVVFHKSCSSQFSLSNDKIFFELFDE